MTISAKSEYGTYKLNKNTRQDSKTEDTFTCESRKKQENNSENKNCTNEGLCFPVETKDHRYIIYEYDVAYTPVIHMLSLADNSFNLPNINHSDKLRCVPRIGENLVTCNSKNVHEILEFLSLLFFFHSSNNVMPYSISDISPSGRLYGTCMIILRELDEEALASCVIYFGVSFNGVLVPATYFMVYTALGVLHISFMDMQLVTEIEDFKLILSDLYHNVNDTITKCIAFLTWRNVFGLVRSTFRSLTNTKSDSQCVMEMSLIESEQVQTENISHEKENSIQGNMCSYNFDISVRQMSHVPVEHVLSPLPSQELRVTVAEPTRNISPKSQCVKQRCNVISDTVDLKSKQNIEDNKKLRYSLDTDLSADSKHDIEKDGNSDLMKELIRKHTTQPLTAHQQVYTIAPVSRAQDEKDEQMSIPSSDRPRVEMDSSHSTHQIEDSHMTSAIAPVMERHDDCEEIHNGACSEQNDSSVVQIDTSGPCGQVCNKELLQMKTSIRTVQHSEDTIGTECSNVTEDSSFHTVVSSFSVSSENSPNPGVDEADIQRFEPLMQVINKIADGQRVPPQITMQYEMLRFCTLRSFPLHNKPYITRIAEAGFYYANNGDEVVCYCCAHRRRNWQETDIPMDIHRQMNPTCRFLVRNSEVNVPIKMQSPTTNDMPTVLPSSHNLIPPQSRQYGVHDNVISITAVNNTASVNMMQHTGQDNSVQTSSAVNTAQNTTQNTETLNFPKQTSASSSTAENRIQTRRAHGNFVQTISSQSSITTTGIREPQLKTAPSSSNTIGRASAELGIEGSAKAAMPKYPKYASKTVRLASYNDCGHIVISPERLAESGLFYAGFGDCVRCFQCGVGLRHWSEEDDPWIEHSRWRKECAFVTQIKGQEFVNLVHMAVQYSETNEDQSPDDRTSLPNEGRNRIQQQDREEIDNLMHTDAAQSVLEMGYHPNIIRQAIRRVMGQRGREGISAANLMEIIFEIEADTTPDIDETVEQSTTEHSPPQSSSNTVTTTEEPGYSQESNSIVPPLPTTTSTNTRGSSRREAVTENCATSWPAVSTSSSTVTHTVSPHTSVALQSMPSTSSGAEAQITRKSQMLEQKKLKAENEKLKQESICTTCKKNSVCIVFLPCGHLVTCEACAPTVRYCTCGKYIKGTVRTYLS